MAYSRTVWVNDSLPAINAENLNKIENGIVESNIFRNLLYMNYSKGSSTTINGVTFTINDDYSITASGTGTSLGYLWLINDNNALKLDNNKTYTWSLNTVSGLFVDVARIVSKKTTSNLKDVTTSEPKKTFQGSYFDDSIKAFLRVQKGLEYNYTIKLQLEENDEATNPVPFAGYIVESGSNDNGSWIKYSDGSMICYGSKDVTFNCSQTWGNLFVGRYEDYISFPQEFIDIPLLQIHTRSTTNASSWLISYDKTTVSKSNFYEVDIARATANSSVPITITFIAIGRWK